MKIVIIALLLAFVCVDAPLADTAKTENSSPEINSPKKNSSKLTSISQASESDMAVINYLGSFVKAINDDEIMQKQIYIKPYTMPVVSMEPTLVKGDCFSVNLKYFKDASPKRGDIIIFEYPEDPTKDFIKRVIAVEGDIISGVEKKIYLNNELLLEPYVVHLEKEMIPKDQNPRDSFGPITVPKNSLFVMGDNRDGSYDSRFWGFVRLEAVIGKPFFIYWSTDPERVGRVVK